MLLFEIFFDAPLSHKFVENLIFWYMKGVQEVCISAKFHLCLICSSWVFKFQMFSYHLKVPLQAAPG